MLYISRAQQSESSEFPLLNYYIALNDVYTLNVRLLCRNARDVNFKNAPRMATVKSGSLGTEARKRREDHQLHPWSNTDQFHWVTHLRWPGSISSAYRSHTHTCNSQLGGSGLYRLRFTAARCTSWTTFLSFFANLEMIKIYDHISSNLLFFLDLLFKCWASRRPGLKEKPEKYFYFFFLGFSSFQVDFQKLGFRGQSAALLPPS